MPPTPAAGAALPRDALLRVAAPLRESLAAAPYAPPEGSSTSIKSLLASLLPSPSQPQPRPTTGGAHEEATDLLFCAAAAGAATAESPALHWVPECLSKAAAAAMDEMAAAGGWGDVGEMVVAMMPEAVPPLKAVVKETCVDTDNDEVGAVKPPKELSPSLLNQQQAPTYNRVADGYSKAPKPDVQCKNRVDTLKKKYKIERAKPASSWQFFDCLDVLLAPTYNHKHGGNPNAATRCPRHCVWASPSAAARR